MRLVLVRHGQTSSNRSGALDTSRPGAPLDEAGLRQAEDLVGRWGEVVGATPVVLAVSPLRRTRQTARPLLDHFGLTPLVRSGIREVRAGDLEMNTDMTSITSYLAIVEAWADGRLDAHMPGGETGRALFARALPVIAEVGERTQALGGQDGVGVIVAHGAIIRALSASLADNLPAALVMAHAMGNAHATVLEWQGAEVGQWLGSFHAVSWNERAPQEWEIPDHVELADPAVAEPARREDR